MVYSQPSPISSMQCRSASRPAASLRMSGIAWAMLMAFVLPVAQTATAASFTVTGTTTSAQSLSTSETGTVATTGTLSVSGSSNAITITGNNATINNQGVVRQTGTGRAIRDNAGVTGLVINNGSDSNASARMQTADADVIQMNVGKGSVTLNNYGVMTSTNATAGGAQVVDFNAITTGASTINNYATGTMTAYEADAVRPGVNGIVRNSGTIKSVTTTGSSSDGVDVQNNSGVRITNDAAGLIEGGRHGITGGPASAGVPFSLGVTSQAGSIIRGANGAGINIDGFNAQHTATIVNRGSIIGNGVTGDGDGIDVDGPASIINYGVIRSQNAYSAPGAGLAYSEGITLGGGSVVNYGTIEGLAAAGNSNAVGRGITLAGNDIASGVLAGTREPIYANTTITNNAGGVVRGQSDSAIVVEGPASGKSIVITNNAGALSIGGGTAAAIRTGADNDVLYNAGRIDGSTSGKAIDLGGGNNSLVIAGGSASVAGSINGGVGGVNTMRIDAGASNRFAYEGAISNFASVNIASGEVTFSGASTYTGATVISGGVLTLDGASRLSASSSLQMDGGTLTLVDAGADGQNFARFALSDDSFIDLGGSALTFGSLGEIVPGATLSILNFDPYGFSDYAFRMFGDYSNSQGFLGLISNTTINGNAASFRFDGLYTEVGTVPEPGTILMLLSGLGLIGGIQRRRNTAPAA